MKVVSLCKANSGDLVTGLLDGGATNALRQGTTEELSSAMEVEVGLAAGSIRLYQCVETGTLLSSQRVEPNLSQHSIEDCHAPFATWQYKPFPLGISAPTLVGAIPLPSQLWSKVMTCVRNFSGKPRTRLSPSYVELHSNPCQARGSFTLLHGDVHAHGQHGLQNHTQVCIPLLQGLPAATNYHQDGLVR